jgi:hypothetical protein
MWSNEELWRQETVWANTGSESLSRAAMESLAGQLSSVTVNVEFDYTKPIGRVLAAEVVEMGGRELLQMEVETQVLLVQGMVINPAFRITAFERTMGGRIITALDTVSAGLAWAMGPATPAEVKSNA